MWQHTNDYQEISEQIDHILEKEAELSLFVQLLKRNLGIFTFVMSFFLMMELFDQKPIEFEPHYMHAQVHEPDSLAADWNAYDYTSEISYAAMLAWSKSEEGKAYLDFIKQSNYYYYYNGLYFYPTLYSTPRRAKDPQLIYPPANWALLRPQHQGPLFAVYCHGLCGCFGF